MAIDTSENGEYKDNLILKKKSDEKKIVAVLSPITKIIVTPKNYNAAYLYERFKRFFGRMPDEREKLFINNKNRFKSNARDKRIGAKMEKSR